MHRRRNVALIVGPQHTLTLGIRILLAAARATKLNYKSVLPDRWPTFQNDSVTVLTHDDDENAEERSKYEDERDERLDVIAHEFVKLVPSILGVLVACTARRHYSIFAAAATAVDILFLRRLPGRGRASSRSFSEQRQYRSLHETS